MKKYLLLFIFGIILFFVTFFLSLNFFHYTGNAMIKKENEKIASIKKIEEGNKVELTNSTEDRIGYNAKLNIKKCYTKCEHELYEEKNVSKDMVNLTKVEFCKKYPNYKILNFSKDQIEVEAKIKGICDNHFKIMLGEDFIEVFRIKSDGEEELYLVTGVSNDYLTKEDKDKLKDGIEVCGIENINSKLEDYE